MAGDTLSTFKDETLAVVTSPPDMSYTLVTILVITFPVQLLIY